MLVSENRRNVRDGTSALAAEDSGDYVNTVSFATIFLTWPFYRDIFLWAEDVGGKSTPTCPLAISAMAYDLAIMGRVE